MIPGRTVSKYITSIKIYAHYWHNVYSGCRMPDESSPPKERRQSPTICLSCETTDALPRYRGGKLREDPRPRQMFVERIDFHNQEPSYFSGGDADVNFAMPVFDLYMNFRAAFFPKIPVAMLSSLRAIENGAQHRTRIVGQRDRREG